MHCCISYTGYQFIKESPSTQLCYGLAPSHVAAYWVLTSFHLGSPHLRSAAPGQIAVLTMIKISLYRTAAKMNCTQETREKFLKPLLMYRNWLYKNTQLAHLMPINTINNNINTKINTVTDTVTCHITWFQPNYIQTFQFMAWHNIITDNIAFQSKTICECVYLLTLVWPWPWPHDLETRPWHRRFEDVTAHQKWSYRRNRKICTKTAKQRQMHYNATLTGGDNWHPTHHVEPNHTRQHSYHWPVNKLSLTLSPPIPLRLYTLPYWSNPPFLTFDIRALWRSVAQMSKINKKLCYCREPYENTVSRNRAKCCTNVRWIAYGNVCKRWMTFKVIQGHYRCYHLIGHILFPISLPL